MKDKGQRSLHLLGLGKRKRWRVLSLSTSPEHVALLCLPGTKVFVMPNGMLKSNQQLVDIIEKVKPEIRLLIEKCNTVRHGLVTYDWTQIAPLDLWNEGWGGRLSLLITLFLTSVLHVLHGFSKKRPRSFYMHFVFSHSRSKCGYSS